MNKFFVYVIVLMIITRLFIMGLFISYKEGCLTQDEGLYHLKALIKVSEWKGQDIKNKLIQDYPGYKTDILSPKYGYNFYTYLIAVYYYLTNQKQETFIAKRIGNRFSLRFFNMGLSILTFLLIYHITKDIFGTQNAKISSFVYAFFPSLVLWSVMIAPDTLLIFCIVAYLYCFQRNKFMWMLFSILIVYFIRSYIAYVLILSSVFSIVKLTKKTWKHLFKGACILSIFIIPYIFFYLKGLAYVIFAPFPWAITSRLQMIALPQIILWYYLLVLIFYGMNKGFRRQTTSFVLCYAFCMFSLFALGEGNIGSLFRHRDLVTPFLLMYAGGTKISHFYGGFAL